MEEKCGGNGKCKHCKKYVPNVAFHSTCCGKNPNARKPESNLVTKYYINSDSGFNNFDIKKTKVDVGTDKIKIACNVGKLDLSYSVDLFATRKEAHEQLLKDVNSWIDSNKKEINELKQQLESAEKTLDENIKLRKKIKSRKS